MLQQKFHFLVHSVELWYADNIHSVVLCCIILHNMIVKYCVECDKREAVSFFYETVGSGDSNYETAESGDSNANISVGKEAGEDGSKIDYESQGKEDKDNGGTGDDGSDGNCIDALEDKIEMKRANVDLNARILLASRSASNESRGNDDDLANKYEEAKKLLLPVILEVAYEQWNCLYDYDKHLQKHVMASVSSNRK